MEALHQKGDQILVPRREQQGPRKRRPMPGRRLPERVHSLCGLDPFRRDRRGHEVRRQGLSLLDQRPDDRETYQDADPAPVPAVLSHQGVSPTERNSGRTAST